MKVENSLFYLERPWNFLKNMNCLLNQCRKYHMKSWCSKYQTFRTNARCLLMPIHERAVAAPFTRSTKTVLHLRLTLGKHGALQNTIAHLYWLPLLSKLWKFGCQDAWSAFNCEMKNLEVLLQLMLLIRAHSGRSETNIAAVTQRVSRASICHRPQELVILITTIQCILT